jgi:hypothetical protein
MAACPGTPSEPDGRNCPTLVPGVESRIAVTAALMATEPRKHRGEVAEGPRELASELRRRQSVNRCLVRRGEIGAGHPGSAIRKYPGHYQHAYSFLPGSPATIEPDQTGRSALDALRLWIRGLRHVLARLSTAAERPELAG